MIVIFVIGELNLGRFEYFVCGWNFKVLKFRFVLIWMKIEIFWVFVVMMLRLLLCLMLSKCVLVILCN